MTVCRQAGFEPDVRYTSTDLQIHLRLVEHGLAAAMLPDLSGRRPPSQRDDTPARRSSEATDLQHGAAWRNPPSQDPSLHDRTQDPEDPARLEHGHLALAQSQARNSLTS